MTNHETPLQKNKRLKHEEESKAHANEILKLAEKAVHRRVSAAKVLPQEVRSVLEQDLPQMIDHEKNQQKWICSALLRGKYMAIHKFKEKYGIQEDEDLEEMRTELRTQILIQLEEELQNLEKNDLLDARAASALTANARIYGNPHGPDIE